MPASNYKLRVSALMGTVYITKVAKNNNVMLDDRIEVPESEFIKAILDWSESKIEKGDNEVSIKNSTGKEIAFIKLFI